MIKNPFLYITILFSFLLSQNDTLNYHISLSIHEELINDFFIGMGEISGKGETAVGSYRWKLLDPKIDIEKDTILFISTVVAKGGSGIWFRLILLKLNVRLLIMIMLI